MAIYLIKRVAQIMVTLYLFFTLIFFMIYAQPGDYAIQLIPDLREVNPQVKLQLERTFGLDKPAWQQYLLHMKNLATGSLGVSFALYPREVTNIILERLPRTVLLFVTASVLSFYMGFTLGKIIAWRRGSLTEYAATLGGGLLFTVFTPWFALMLIWLLGLKAGWFPIGKFLEPLLWRDASVDANYVFNRMILTALALSLLLLIMFLVARKTRFRWRRWLLPGSAAISLAVMVAAWDSSGIGYLALDIVKHMVLPVLTLTLISFAGTMLLTRNSMLEIMREDYVLAARAKGLPEKQVRDKHVARNAILPVITSFVFSLAFAIDGGVIIESVFSWPGMGQTLVSAVSDHDIPLAVGAFAFTGVFILLAHLAADLLHMYLDPRLRHW